MLKYYDVDRLVIFGRKQDSLDDASIVLHDDQDQGQIELSADDYNAGFIGWVRGGLVATRKLEGQLIGH